MEARQREVIIKQGEPKMMGVTNAKTMRKALETLLAQQTRKGNTELQFYTQGILNLYNKFHPEKPSESKLIRIELKNWKGEGELFLGKIYTNDFIVTEYIKDKDTGVVEEKERIIKNSDVNFLSNILSRVSVGQSLNYKQIVSMIILSKELPVSLDAFNGGKNRALYYFPLYYYPIKVLEELKVIQYHGRGGITRLK